MRHLFFCLGSYAGLVLTAPLEQRGNTEAGFPFFEGKNNTSTCKRDSRYAEQCFGSQRYCGEKLWIANVQHKHYDDVQDCLADRRKDVKLYFHLGQKNTAACDITTQDAESCFGTKDFCEQRGWEVGPGVHRHYENAEECLESRAPGKQGDALDQETRNSLNLLPFYYAQEGQIRCDHYAYDAEKCMGSLAYCEDFVWRWNEHRIQYKDAAACLGDRGVTISKEEDLNEVAVAVSDTTDGRLPFFPEPVASIGLQCDDKAADAERCLGTYKYCDQEIWTYQTEGKPKQYNDSQSCLADRRLPTH
ncbi:hypothetical protein AAL_02410 [Moelleriella libera RCEF 2490]|uniref:Uncharacterized protein n=1 Tax=Moelleriella libera RCEF 2490 TaxID=1081109 RepID=A0A168EJK0_9HYPO|nr:hypothetical protein AAL_02410 [Moelleriella libera RCEF 2490]